MCVTLTTAAWGYHDASAKTAFWENGFAFIMSSVQHLMVRRHELVDTIRKHLVP